MFTAEVYDEILRKLSRDDLDAVQLVDRRSRNVISQNLATNGPLRQLHSLWIDQHHEYRIRRQDWYEHVVVRTEEELTARMEFAVVELFALDSDVTMDEHLLRILMPLKSAWKNTHCFVSSEYASTEVLEQTFNELLICRQLDVVHDAEPRESSFMSLASVPQCRKLCFGPGP